MVEAGAVADARAASTIEKARLRCRTKYVRMNTKTEARRASKSVMMTTLIPFFLRTSNRKNWPVENAIKARAMSGRKSMPLMIVEGIRLRQYGPIKMPAVMYAVTFGRRSFLVIRVIKKPSRRIVEIEITATEAEEPVISIFSIQDIF